MRKTATPPGSHVFQPTETIFKLVQDTIGTHVLTKFHEDWTINVASRVFTRFNYSHMRKTATPPGSNLFLTCSGELKIKQNSKKRKYLKAKILNCKSSTILAPNKSLKHLF